MEELHCKTPLSETLLPSQNFQIKWFADYNHRSAGLGINSYDDTPLFYHELLLFSCLPVLPAGYTLVG